MDVVFAIVLVVAMTATVTYLAVTLLKNSRNDGTKSDGQSPKSPSFENPPFSYPTRPPTSQPSKSPSTQSRTKIEVVASPLSWGNTDPSSAIMRTVAAVEKFYHMGIRMTFPDAATMRAVVGNPANVYVWDSYTNPEFLQKQTDWPSDWTSYSQLSFELFAEDFASAPCPQVKNGRVQPGLAVTRIVKVLPDWQLELEVGNVDDVHKMVDLRDRVLQYDRFNIDGIAREDGLLYSIYSSFNRVSGRQNALSNTCNTLVADILKVLKFQKPDILTATRDAWDLIDDGLTPSDWNDGGAVAYFQELAKEISSIETGKTIYTDPVGAWKCIQKIMNPVYIVSYFDEDRTEMKLFRVTQPPPPPHGQSIRN